MRLGPQSQGQCSERFPGDASTFAVVPAPPFAEHRSGGPMRRRQGVRGRTRAKR